MGVAAPSHWGSYLSSKMVGPQRSHFIAALAEDVNSVEADRAGWKAAARNMGLQQVVAPYAHQAAVSSGAQLFVLASTLFGLGLYTSLGQPNGNAAGWKAQIVLR